VKDLLLILAVVVTILTVLPKIVKYFDLHISQLLRRFIIQSVPEMKWSENKMLMAVCW